MTASVTGRPDRGPTPVYFFFLAVVGGAVVGGGTVVTGAGASTRSTGAPDRQQLDPGAPGAQRDRAAGGVDVLRRLGLVGPHPPPGPHGAVGEDPHVALADGLRLGLAAVRRELDDDVRRRDLRAADHGLGHAPDRALPGAGGAVPRLGGVVARLEARRGTPDAAGGDRPARRRAGTGTAPAAARARRPASNSGGPRP